MNAFSPGQRPPETIRSFVHLLHWRATTWPDAPALTFLPEGEGDGVTWTYRDLWAHGGGVALALRDRGAAPGERVAVVVDEGLAFHAALFGCMMAGVLAVPLHPPDPQRPDRTTRRITQVCAQAQVGYLITSPGHSATLDRAWPGPLPPVIDVTTVTPAVVDEPTQGRHDLAYLQYTSGSTSLPKGVAVSHHNLLHQLGNFDTGYDHDAQSVIVSWLPGTHDLGLVYGRMMPLFVGFRGVFFAPADFVRKPGRWLSAITKFRGTHSPTPNFGLELAVARTTPEQRAAFDLSSLKVVLNGAEPIRRASERRFVEAFTPHGLPKAALTHAYGMSESTAKITSEPINRTTPRFLDVRRDAYEAGRVELAGPHEPGPTIEVAGNGRTVGDTTAVIVDPETHIDLGADRVGEVWVSGDTVATGYFADPTSTEATFGAHTAEGRGPFLRTGDLGFLHEGELFLSGRLKDLVILRGENHHPQDLEWAVAHAHPAIRAGGIAAFAVPTDGEDSEQLVIAIEVNPTAESAAVFAAIRQALAAQGVAATTLVLVPPRAVPKTSSGKLQRSRARAQFIAGELPEVARAERTEAPSSPEPADLAATVRKAPPRRRRRLVARHLADIVGALVGLAAADVPHDMPLRDLGLDSVTAVDLVERVGRQLGGELAGTVLFDHPTIDALTEHLLTWFASD